jgi:2-succinyl-5-enolpyruvyl-6-hydroxy-3-cyclohexene-1-carboxylate synthase
MPIEHDRTTQAFVEQLYHSGVRHAVICPGSRSTPLTLAFTRPDTPFEAWLHIDERSAGYFALGLARQTGAPVAVVVTSGTAAANLLPAAVEASLSRVPLILLTGDRPPELRDVGAAQTIEQVGMFGGHAKWSVDVPVADGGEGLVRRATVTAARAARVSLETPAGPVHLNFPFREPLIEITGPAESGPPADLIDAPPPAEPDVARELASRIARELSGCRGVVVCGPESGGLPASRIVALADGLGWPVLADPLSGLRTGLHRLDAVVETADSLVREPEFASRARPDAVIRFGAAPTSKALAQYLALPLAFEGRPARSIVVDPAGAWRDPDATASTMVQAGPAAFCDAMISALGESDRADAEWRPLWTNANVAARLAIRDALAEIDEPFEGRVPAEIAPMLPDGSTLIVGNSMPVRDADSFLPATPRNLKVLGTRGASGIDGVVSTAAGAAAARDGRVVLLIGDLSFLHDLNGLWAVGRHGLDLTVVLVNNDGGGIFHFLPQAQAIPDRFEEWFGTAHGLDLEHAVALHGGRYQPIDVGPGIGPVIAEAIARPGLDVLELRTERTRNVELHVQVWQRVAATVNESLRGLDEVVREAALRK